MAKRFKLITENFGLKVISLMLAIGFWFYAVGEESIEMTRNVALDIKVRNEKLSIVERSTDYLKVTFEAPRQLISSLSSDELVAVRELEGVEKAGDYTFAVSARDLPIPYPEVRISKIYPALVTVTLDELIVKKLTVSANLVGEPAYGYRVDAAAIQLDPNAVLVEGPKAVLETKDMILTEPIQMVGRVRSFRRMVEIPHTADLKVIGEGVTDIQIPIIAEFSDMEFPDLEVHPMGSPVEERFVVLETKTVTLAVKGPRALLGKLEPIDILVYVDVEGLKDGDHEIPVSVILPSDLSLKGDPPIVSVRVRKFKV